MNEIKQSILLNFPILISGYKIEVLKLSDLVERSKWPSYGGENIVFNLILENEDNLMQKYGIYSNDDRLAFSIYNNQNVIGIFSFNKIDWQSMVINDMTIRINPIFCNKGIGKIILTKLCEIMFNNKFKSIRLDVNSKNIIAQKCYHKCGFKIIEEINTNNKIHYIMEKKFG